MKILLADYPHYSGQARRRAVEKLGHELVFFDHSSDPFLKPRWAAGIKRWIKRLLPNLPSAAPVLGLQGSALGRSFVSLAGSTQPDLILVAKGSLIPAEALGRARETSGARMACYFGDPLDQPQLRDFAQKVSPYYDIFFIIDEPEILKQYPLSSHHISVAPCAVDPSLLRPVDLSAAEREAYAADVTFIGSVTPLRVDLLNAVARLPIRFRIWGRSIVEGWAWTRAEPSLARYFAGRYAEDDEMAKIYSASKIVLNIHGVYGKSGPFRGLPYRPFEVTACRAFLLTDECVQIRRLFAVGEELDVYDSPESLASKIELYLQQPELRAAIAERGYRRTLREHTWEVRMRQVVNASVERLRLQAR